MSKESTAQYFALSNINHNGTTFVKGDEITLGESQANVLLREGVISEDMVLPDPVEKDSRVLSDKERANTKKNKPAKEQISNDESEAGDDEIDEALLENKTVAQLREIAKGLEIAVSGAKPVLIARIQEASEEAVAAESGDEDNDPSTDL